MNTGNTIVVGLGLGDESKGSIVAYLAEKYQADSIVRYNGGPQAAHNVISAQGIHHCFSQFGAGSFTPNVETFLSKYMFLKPTNLIEEAHALKEKIACDPFRRIKIDERCVIVTPMHKLIGQMKELTRTQRHGSVGMGVGQAVYESITKDSSHILYLKDIMQTDRLFQKLETIYADAMIQADLLLQSYCNPDIAVLMDEFQKQCSQNVLFDTYGYVASIFHEMNIPVSETYFNHMLQSKKRLIFEGAQGVLLDPRFGFLPHITKTFTTSENADALLGEIDANRIGILRAYATRHGAGPLVTEDMQLGKMIPDLHNVTHAWQGQFRIGWFDLLMARYSLSILENKLDSIALTNLDRFDTFATIKVCTSYEYCGASPHLLDLFFDWERIGSKIKITRFKKASLRSSEQQALLTQILFDCKPWDFQVFDGWRQDTSTIRSYKDLPPNACKYLDFIESSLGVPISIISVGPRTDQKFEKLSLL